MATSTPVCRADRQEVHDHRLERYQDRAEHHHQQHEAEASLAGPLFYRRLVLHENATPADVSRLVDAILEGLVSPTS
jgi:hypothetical protein